MPMLPAWLMYSIRLRSFVWFAASNPAIEYGGFFGESKAEIMDHIPANFKPRTQYLEASSDWQQSKQTILNGSFTFPFVLKPNVGERGGDVVIIEDFASLDHYLQNHSVPLVVQEFIDLPDEFGVLYHRMPGTREGQITSLVQKEFMEVVGDGERTVCQILDQEHHARASFQMERWKREKPEMLDSIPTSGQKVKVEAIGNHCLGTKFIDANSYITSDLNRVFDEIVADYDGFCYGRFDLKVSSLQDFLEGRNIRIFELNGVSSEPGHVYDPKHTVFYAYRELYRHWHIIFKICRENVRNGFKIAPAREVFGAGIRHFRQKAREHRGKA